MNMQQIMQMIQQLSNNPQQILQRFGLPQNLNSPNEVAEYLVNNGRVTQAQINQANQMYNQMFKR